MLGGYSNSSFMHTDQLHKSVFFPTSISRSFVWTLAEPEPAFATSRPIWHLTQHRTGASFRHKWPVAANLLLYPPLEISSSSRAFNLPTPNVKICLVKVLGARFQTVVGSIGAHRLNFLADEYFWPFFLGCNVIFCARYACCLSSCPFMVEDFL
jgi:hypothetical protein